MKPVNNEATLPFSGNFKLVRKCGVGMNETPWRGLEVVSTGPAKRHVVTIELETKGFPEFNGTPVEYKYRNARVSYGMRMERDGLDDTREFIEVLKEAVNFAEEVNKYLETLED